MSFKIHTLETAPAGSKEILDGYVKKMGMVPNLIGIMASSPSVIGGYAALSQLFEKTSFTPAERQIVLLETSAVNGCAYCMAAHSLIAKMQKIPDAVVGAVRDGEPISDAKLQALRAFTRSVVETRGYPAESALKGFLAAGYDRTQVLEVILGVTMKTLSNYVNHVAETPLDPAFESARWSPTQRAA